MFVKFGGNIAIFAIFTPPIAAFLPAGLRSSVSVCMRIVGLESGLVFLQLHQSAAVVHKLAEAVEDKGADSGENGTHYNDYDAGNDHICIGVAVVTVSVRSSDYKDNSGYHTDNDSEPAHELGQTFDFPTYVVEHFTFLLFWCYWNGST